MLAHERDRLAHGVARVHVDERRQRLAPRVEDGGDAEIARAHEAEVGHPLVVEDPREVAAAGVGDEHDDDVVFGRLVRDAHGGSDGGAARPTDEETLLARDSAGHQERRLVADRDDPVDDRRVVGLGPEVLADALDQVRPPRSTRVHRAFGVGADDLHARVLRLEVAADAGDRAARAESRDEVGDPAGGLAPDLGPGRVDVRLRVRGVRVLVRTERAGDLADEPLGRRVVRLRILGRDRDRAHHDLGAVRAQERDLLGRDLVGHDEHALVAALRGDDGEPDTGVARCGLDDRAARLQQTGALGGVDHRDRGTVLDAAAWVRRLELHRERRDEAL